jgi:hypothetical protein
VPASNGIPVPLRALILGGMVGLLTGMGFQRMLVLVVAVNLLALVAMASAPLLGGRLVPFAIVFAWPWVALLGRPIA